MHQNDGHPSIGATAFHCPHCEKFAHQSWFYLLASPVADGGTPICILDDSDIVAHLADIADEYDYDRARDWAAQMLRGIPFLGERFPSEAQSLDNVVVSQCYGCKSLALWIHDRLIWPQRATTPLPNPDLPEDARRDYEEASKILSLSPRGAAALLRLGLQKLCKHIGGSGENINDDIAMLVRKGLDPHVQQALDVVRVIGNNAVHPGQIDLRDDRASAETLFALLNIIVENTISRQKHIAEMYERLPEVARKAIERRDGPKAPSS